jgi:chaperonin GroES
MKFKPLGERALVKRVAREEQTASGIVLPDTAREEPQTAEVVEVGQFEEGIKVEVGDVVVVRRFAGTEFDLNGEEHLIVDAEDMLGVVDTNGRKDQQDQDQQQEEKGLVDKIKDTLTGE